MGDNKLPVTTLQEYCVGRKIQVPFYEDVSEQIVGMNQKIFTVRVAAASRVAIGSGASKKQAKHIAAAQLLDQLGHHTSFTPKSGAQTQDSIIRLLDMCVDRNWPLPDFQEISASGPSHCPEFTIKCTLASMVREAKASTKKLAKGKAATLMLQVIQEMQMHNPEKLQLIGVREAMETEEETDESVIKTYRQYKKQEIKKQPGVRLCDRHKFFTTLGADKLEQARKCLDNTYETAPERINTALLALKLTFEIKDEPSYGQPLKSFTLNHEQYDCYFVSFADTFWNDLLTYFTSMLT